MASVKRMDARAQKKEGFTLFETLIYAGLLAMFLSLATLTVNSILGTNMDMVEREEVLANQEFVGQKLGWFVKSANEVLVPSPNSSSAVELKLQEYATSTDPAHFSLSSSTLFLSLANSAPLPITNSRVQITAFITEHFATSQASTTLKVSLGVQSVAKPSVSSTAVFWFTLPN